jgi:hypothetical protein
MTSLGTARAGGRAVLLDADRGTRLLSHLDHDILTAFNRTSLTEVANPYAARHIQQKSAELDSHWIRTWAPPRPSPRSPFRLRSTQARRRSGRAMA